MTTRLYPTFVAALESLTQRHQQLLALHEVDQVSTDAIGKMLGISSAQARIDLLHARRAMCQRLSDQRRAAA